MKKITLFSIALFSAVFMMPLLLMASPFSDVGQHRNRTAIEYLNQNGIVQGYEDGTYRPEAKINRAEFTKIIIEANYDNTTIENCLPQQMQPNWTYTFFPDVDRNAWYAKYVCVAKIKGVVSGYEDGLFRPSNEINKAESIKIIVNSHGYKVPEVVAGNTYSDVMPDAWYAPYVKAAFDANLIEDTGSSALNPGNPLTRAGMSEMAYRALVSKGGIFQSQELSTKEPAVKSTSGTLKKVTTANPVEAKDQMIDLLTNLTKNTAESDLTSSELEMLDSPEQNYLYNAKLIRTANIAKIEEKAVDSEDESWEFIDQMIESQTSIEMLQRSTRTLMSLHVPINEGEISYHADNDRAYIGVLMKDSELNDSIFYCYPFVYNGFWKLKLPSAQMGPVDFSRPGLIESCSKEIKEESKLTGAGLIPARFSLASPFAARVYLNGHLIKDSGGLEMGFSTTHLPLKKGTNTLEVLTKNHKDYVINWEHSFMEKGEFEESFNLKPDTLSVKIDTMDNTTLVDFDMSENDERATKTFSY